jgi:uncharacterized protein YegJ (DUF2314 family)
MLKALSSAIVLALALGASLAPGPARAEDQAIMVPGDDSAMVAAIAHARELLDGFLALAGSESADISEPGVKVMIRDGSKVEHFWVTPFARDGDTFTGVLANEPQLVTTVKAGQTYSFTRADISDWMYHHGDHIHGAYTLKAMLPRLPEAQAEQFRAMLVEED